MLLCIFSLKGVQTFSHQEEKESTLLCVFQLVGMLDMSVPVVAKLRRLLDSLPRETLPDILASMIRTSNKEKLQVKLCVGVWETGRERDRESYILDYFNIVVCLEIASPHSNL